MCSANKSYLVVFDIETVPDVDVCKSLVERGEVSDLDCDDFNACVNFLNKNFSFTSNIDRPFIKHALHKIIVIGCVVCELLSSPGGQNSFVIKKVSSYPFDEAELQEKDLINAFFQSLKRRNHPTLVSFNGHSFDLPVLQYRAMKHGLTFPFLVRGYNENNFASSRSSYSYRYDPSHCDLLDSLRFFGASSTIKLDEICLMLGLPGKMDLLGNKVSDLYFQKKIKTIKEYCEIDVLNTYLVYLRYALLTGAISEESYKDSCSNVVKFINANRERENLVSFLNCWERSSNISF